MNAIRIRCARRMTMDANSLPAIFLILAAPFVGSFLGLAVERRNARTALVFARSRCPCCQTALGPAELIPIVSFAYLKGRCRHCRARISSLYPTMEISATAVAVIGISCASGQIGLVTVLLGWCLLVLSAVDVREYVLPDAGTVPLIAAGLTMALAFDATRIADHLIGAAGGYASFCLIAYLYCHLRHRDGLGLGDAKLFAAVGSWLSWENLPIVIFIAGATGLGFALLTRRPSQELATQRIPFGPFLALGFWAIWLVKASVPSG